MEWYYSDGKQQFGPVADADLATLESTGRITPDTLVWHAGLNGWQAYRTVKPQPAAATPESSMAAAATAPARYCTQCGQQRAASDILMIGSVAVCPNCKDAYLQKLREGVQPGGPGMGTRQYAGFWLRVVAQIIDSIIVGIAQSVVTVPLIFMITLGAANSRTPETAVAASMGVMGFVWLFSIGASCLYESWFLVNKGATLGKLALSLQVVRVDGGQITWGLAIGRHFAKYVSGMILCIGYIMVGFDAEKRGLHDMICNTRVVKKAS
jgi:uncharacterized RDD family membrane protein YckC